MPQHNLTHYAEIAWRYYQPGVGVNPSTGLHYANRDWHRFTDWDLGSYIMAIVDAERLGMLPSGAEWGSDNRINRIMDFLQTRQLTDDGLPYLVYDAETGGLPPEVGPQETNVYDSGRLFVALHHLKESRPALSSTIDWIVKTRCNYSKLVAGFPTDPTPEMYYLAKGFSYFGFDNEGIRAALDSPRRMMAGEMIDVYGVQLPNVKLISEQILHAMFEVDANPDLREIARRTCVVQERRWMETARFTAFTEGALEVPPYYIYEYIILPPRTWVITAIGQGDQNMPPVAYLKAAMGFHAIYQTNYTDALLDSLLDQLETGQGFCEGVDEEGVVIRSLTDKTNSMIISAARYNVERLSLSSFPAPFVESGTVNNTLIVIGESKPHGPCLSAHTIDTLGGMLIASRLGLEAGSGQLKSAMDGWLIDYDGTTGDTEILDAASNLIIVGSPGVNLVAYHFNRSKTDEGYALPEVLFIWNRSSGSNFIWVQASGNSYQMEHDGGKMVADYGVIQVFGDRGTRFVVMVYGIGAEGTRISSEVLRDFDEHDLQGRALILRYSDSDLDGDLDTVSVVEVIN